jgi:uncharacterized protein
VTAASRSGRTDGWPEHSALTPVSLDAADPARVAEAAADHDAVVSAISPPRDGTDPTAPLLDTYRALLAGVRASGTPRLVVVGAGERTGSFRLGGDQLLTAEDGTSRISAEDFAVALVDELEKNEAIGRRISVAY